MRQARQMIHPWDTWGDGEGRKILIVRLGSLGDIVHTIPAQQLLSEMLPRAEIHWLVEPGYVDLLRRIPGITRLWVADTKAWRRRVSSLLQIHWLVRGLRRERFDVVLDFQGLLKSAILGRLAGADSVAGFSKSLLREPLARYCYTRSIEIEPGQRHQVETNLDLVTPPRYAGPARAAIPLRIPSAAYDYVDAQFHKFGLSKPVLLNPGAGWTTKRWPVERFVELAARIRRRLDLPVLFTYGPGEEDLIRNAKRRAAGMEGVEAMASTILELSALCRRSRLMVAGDTGPMHLAVAMGTPVVALIGPAYTWRTGPFNREDKVVSHDRSCPRPYTRKCIDHFCMDIEVDKVYQAVVSRLESGRMRNRRSRQLAVNRGREN